MPARTLNMVQAAEHLGVKHRTLQGYYQIWGIPHYKVGRSVVFRVDELEEWFQQQRRAA